MEDNSLFKTFNIQDAQKFADNTGDFNPIHLNTQIASQTVFGGCIVHGVHLVLWALERWFESTGHNAPIVKISATFSRPVLLGESVKCSFPGQYDRNVVPLTLCVASGEVACIKFQLSKEGLPVEPERPVANVTTPSSQPHDPSTHDIAQLSGAWQLPLPSTDLVGCFPHVVQSQGRDFLQSLCQMSVLVGMHCPGLQSVFSEFTLDRPKKLKGRNTIEYVVDKWEPRFSFVRMKVSTGEFAGSVSGFVRPRKVLQQSLDSLSEDLALLRAEQPFAAHKPLIIGGSRGLGQLACKILALGGARPTFTFLRDVAGADETIQELTKFGLHVDARQYDVCSGQDAAKVLASEMAATHLYYFATPAIFVGQKGTFSDDLLDKFMRVYVTGLATLIKQMLPFGLIGVCAPSTIALEENAPNMLEYCVAKAGMEQLCHSLQAHHKGLNVQTPRLPRLATDQTASFAPVKNANPLRSVLETVLATQGLGVGRERYFNVSGEGQ